jgi:UDP-glucuronate decarboxylase
LQLEEKRLKVLVTGGAGFLGAHLCRELLKRNYSVIALDNLYTGSRENIRDLQENPKFNFVTADVTSDLNYQIDGIFNLACPASPVHYQKNPIETIRTNILGSLNVLELASRSNVRVLQASTSEVYGDPLENPQSETYWGNVNPIGIRSCYDEGKRAAETLFFDYHRQNGVDIRVARIFNTYGPGMQLDDGRVVSNFILQAITHKPLTVYGDGGQTRSFCYVSDLIDGLVKLFESEEKNISPINLGNPTQVSMNELARTVIRMTNSKSKIEYKPLPQDDPKLRCPNISKAKSLLNWSPQIDIQAGLTSTISDIKSRIS